MNAEVTITLDAEEFEELVHHGHVETDGVVVQMTREDWFQVISEVRH